MDRLIAALERRKIRLRERITLDRTNDNFVKQDDIRYRELKFINRLLRFYERGKNA